MTGPSAEESLVGRTIAGRYVIESVIGSGAMGSVYRARQLEIDKAVAIKVLRKDLTAEPSALGRFKREAKTASRLDHPNSVRVLDYGEESDGTCFLVMELLEGRTLFHILRDEGPLPASRIVDLLRQVLAALAVAHDLGIIHRDLKPENIMVHATVDDEGRTTEVVKVCDFGVAKMTGSRQEAAEQGQEMLTSHGIVVGTPEYMSPEQGRGQKLDGRSDLYAVGVILYQLLTGRVPFMADTPVNVLLKHVMERPIPPSRVNRAVNRALEQICMKAMSKPPAQRHQHAREMRAELTRALEGSAPEPQSSPRLMVRTESHDADPESETIELSSESIRKVPTQPTLRSQLMSVPPSARQSRAKRLAAIVLVVAAAIVVVAFLRGTPGTSQTPVETKPALTGVAESASAPVAAPEPDPSASAAPIASASASSSAVAPVESVAAVTSAAPVASSTDASTATSPAAAAIADAEPAGPSANATSASATPNASATPEASVTEAVETGRVFAGSVRCDRAPAADVLAALPMGKLTQCYREQLKSHPGLSGGATLHIKMENDGWVGEASFAGNEALAEVGKCIARSVAGRRIANAQPGTSGAEVDLTFKPD
ncbi:MAG: serine/threonine protein kinase [Labilithrix sp.]|nr:serine/threonine protein kinase [Labilithrix sp.]